MKVFFSPKVVLGLMLLLSLTSCVFTKVGNADKRRLDAVATDIHKDDPKENTKTDVKAKDAGSITDKNGKKIEHLGLYYIHPKPQDPSACDTARQIPSQVDKNMKKCQNYKDAKWDGFMMDAKEQAKAYPNLAKFNEKYYQQFQGKNIETNPMYSAEKYPSYVYEIGLCQSKFWSQNLVNNKIMYNSQVTDYDDIQYSICAKYDVVARSCLIGSSNPDYAKNACWNFYRLQSTRAGEYKSMDLRRLGMGHETNYDDTYTKSMLDGTYKKKRNGKYTKTAASRLQVEVKYKEECLKHIYSASECTLWRNMIPAAFQREIMQMTYLHKTTQACLPCADCKKCDACPKCASCDCKPLTPWEQDALHLAVAVDDQSGDPIKEGVLCDNTVLKPINDAIKQDGTIRTQLIDQMRSAMGPSGDINANKESKSNLLVLVNMAMLLIFAFYN